MQLSRVMFHYPGSQASFWGEEVTSPPIVGLNTILVRLCHPIEGLGGLLTKLFLARWLNYQLFHAI